MEKTNVMRILDKHKINYQVHYYGDSGLISGMEVANYLKENPNQVFKTLVTMSKKKEYYVFVIPVCQELDLKKSALAVHEKSVEMIPFKELLKVTGYIHGGCSPIGMKKQFVTVLDSSATSCNYIMISAGKIGYQIEIQISDLEKIIPIIYADITKHTEITDFDKKIM